MDEKRIIESALFMVSKPLSIEELAKVVKVGALGFVKSKVEELKKEYEEKKSAIEIVEIEGKWLMRVRSEYLPYVKDLVKESELSKAELKVLALVAKNPDMRKSDVAKRLGSSVYTSIKSLVEKGFIVEKKEKRSTRLNVTEKFKNYFKIS